MSLRTRRKGFNACVRSALLHGSETWAPTAPDLQRLRRNDRSMVRRICGVRDDDEVSSDSLCAMLGVEEVTAALCTRRLRWYGHVARSSKCINSITRMTIPSTRRRGRPKKTWSEYNLGARSWHARIQEVLSEGKGNSEAFYFFSISKPC